MNKTNKENVVRNSRKSYVSFSFIPAKYTTTYNATFNHLFFLVMQRKKMQVIFQVRGKINISVTVVLLS